MSDWWAGMKWLQRKKNPKCSILNIPVSKTFKLQIYLWLWRALTLKTSKKSPKTLNKHLLTEHNYTCLLNLFLWSIPDTNLWVSCYHRNAKGFKQVYELFMLYRLPRQFPRLKSMCAQFKLVWKVMLSTTELHNDVHWRLLNKCLLQSPWSKTSNFV